MRKGIVAALALAVLAATPGAGASGIGEPICTPNDRACRITSSNAYLASLVSHDGSEIPLHPDAQRTENGNNTGDGAEDIVAANESAVMYVITGIRDLRWYVEGDQAVSVYLLDTLGPPTYIFERFQVNDGLIEVIDARFYIDIAGLFVGPESLTARPEGPQERLTASNHGPFGPVPWMEGNEGETGPRGSSTAREAVEGAAQAFLDALDAGDATGLALADDARWTINRVAVADSGDDVAAMLDGFETTVDDIHHYVVDGDDAIVYFDVDDTLAAARVRAPGGVISEIEQVVVTSF